MPSILAHGALGPFDEIIFLGIALVFLVMMAVSWLRSQQMEDELWEDDHVANSEPARASEAERFELE